MKSKLSKKNRPNLASRARQVRSKLRFGRGAQIFVALFLVSGLLIVWRSLAGSPTLYPQQYSMYLCGGFSNSADPPAVAKTPTDYSCVDQSAESLSYRLYKGHFGAEPSTTLYSSYTQKLAGDRMKPAAFSQLLYQTRPRQSLSNTQFVEAVYRDLYGTALPAASLATWKTPLDSGKVDRPATVLNMAVSSGAKDGSRAKFVIYRKSKPRVAVTQTLLAGQRARLKEAQQLKAKTEPNYAEITRRIQTAQSLSATVKSVSQKANASITLANITSSEKSLTDIGALTQEIKNSTWVTTTTASYERAKALDGTARAISSYSPDIPSTEITAIYSYMSTTNAAARGAQDKLSSIGSALATDLKTIESKYQSELERKGRAVASKYGTLQSNQPSGLKYWMDDAAGKKIHILRIDLTNPKLKLRASTYAERGKTPSQFAQAVGAFAAINADYRNLDVPSDYLPSGIAVGNGGVWPGTSDKVSSSFLACTASSDCILEKRLSTTPHDNKYTNVIAGGGGASGVLLEPGFSWTAKPGDPGCASDTEHTCRDAHPRTAIGLSGDRKMMWWVMVEGRQDPLTGLSMFDLTNIFKKLNAKHALNLDGGGSSGMFLNGRCINGRPSDEQAERKVTNSLGVVVVP